MGILKILDRFEMTNAKPVVVPLAHHFKLSIFQSPTTAQERTHMEKVLYASTVGSLMYLMVCTRPDLAYSMSLVSRFMANPGEEHWSVVKWIPRYIKGSLDSGLMFEGTATDKNLVKGYVDSNIVGSINKRKSLTGYIFTIGNIAVSWKAKLQHVVALSSIEAEYMAVTEAFKEAKWMKGFMEELGHEQESLIVYCDNQSAIHLFKHQVFHKIYKHNDVRMHFVREIIESGEVIIHKISTDNNPADMCTKVIGNFKFQLCMQLVNVSKCMLS